MFALVFGDEVRVRRTRIRTETRYHIVLLFCLGRICSVRDSRERSAIATTLRGVELILASSGDCHIERKNWWNVGIGGYLFGGYTAPAAYLLKLM